MATSTKTRDVDESEAPAPTPTQIAQPPFVPVVTIEDEASGVRRLLPSPDPGWRPAPVDPSDLDVARAEQRLAREEAEANGEPYELPDGTVVQTTPEGKAEAEAEAAKEAEEAELKAQQASVKSETANSRKAAESKS
jgi:hypothetical protein